jgi:hypothetical protein
MFSLFMPRVARLEIHELTWLPRSPTWQFEKIKMEMTRDDLLD